MRSWLCSAVLVSALALLLVASTVAAAPPPTLLCATCDSGLEGATDRGTLDIYLEENGDSRWVERTPVESTAADRYADDPDELERAVEAPLAYYGHVAADDRADLSTVVEDGTVVVSYRVEDVATAGVGDAWIVDYFYAGGTATRYHISADRLTLHPPDGAAVRTHPSDAALEEGALTWEGGDPGRMGSDFDRHTLVTYGPAGISTTAAAHATVATTLSPQVGHHAAWGGLLPAFVVGAAALATARSGRTIGTERVRRRASRLGRDYLGVGRLEDAVVAVGVAGVAGALLGAGLGIVLDDWLMIANSVMLGVGAGVYAAIVVQSRRPDDPTTRALFGSAFVGALVCAAMLLALSRSLVALAPAALALSAFAFLPLGHATERRATGWIAASAVVVLAGPFLAMATLAPLYVFGLPPIYHGFVLLPAALLVAVAGYPLAVVGRRLAEPDQ